MKHTAKRVTVRGSLTEQAIADALIMAKRPVLAKLIVPAGKSELRADRIVRSPGALFGGAEVEVDMDMDPETWAVIA